MAHNPMFSLLLFLSSGVLDPSLPLGDNGLLLLPWQVGFDDDGCRELRDDIHQNAEKRMGKKTVRKKSKMPSKVEKSHNKHTYLPLTPTLTQMPTKTHPEFEDGAGRCV